MRNRLLACLLAVLISTPALADWTPGKYMKQATTRTLANAVVQERASSTLGLAKGICFLGALLKKNGGSCEFNISLSDSKTYMFVGGGDDDATDVDIKIKDSKGNVVGSDTKTDNEPIVKFRPAESGTYTIVLSNHSDMLAFCALVVLHSGGHVMNVDNMDNTISKIFSLCNALDENTSESLSFHDESNQWCFFGYNMDKSSSETVSNMNLGGKKHYLLGSSQDSDIDVDLCLMNSKATDEIKCDKENDATPIVDYTTNAASRYGMKITNSSSSSRSFVLTAILTAND